MSIITGPGAYRDTAGKRRTVIEPFKGAWVPCKHPEKPRANWIVDDERYWYYSDGTPYREDIPAIVGPWVPDAYLDAGAASFAGLEAEREEDYFERLWATAVREKHEAWVERDHAIEERDTARAARARAQQHLQEVTWQLKEARLYVTGLERERDALYVKLAAVRAVAGEGV